jgi:hypothetical protein
MINFSRKVVDKNVKQEVQVWSPEILPTIQRREKKTFLEYERRKIYLISNFGTD